MCGAAMSDPLEDFDQCWWCQGRGEVVEPVIVEHEDYDEVISQAMPCIECAGRR